MQVEIQSEIGSRRRPHEARLTSWVMSRHPRLREKRKTSELATPGANNRRPEWERGEVRCVRVGSSSASRGWGGDEERMRVDLIVGTEETSTGKGKRQGAARTGVQGPQPEEAQAACEIANTQSKREKAGT